MSLDIYNDAFKSLSILNEDLFDTSTLGVQKLQSFLDDDLDGDDEIEVIDAEADTTDDLENSYVGKVIVDCNVCHSHIFKDREDIDIDDSGLVNGEDACPYCGEQEGFVIIGQIEAFDENESDEIPEEDEVTETTGEEAPAEEPNKEKNESLKFLKNRKTIKESYKDSEGKDYLLIVDDAIMDADDNGEYLGNVHSDTLARIEEIGGVEGFYQGEVADDEKAFEKAGAKVGDTIRLGIRIVDMGGESVPHADFLGVVKSADKSGSFNESVGDDSLADRVLSYLDKLESRGELTESMNNVKVETDDNVVTVNSDESGKVTVTTEPLSTNDFSGEGEMITPLSDDDMNTMIDSNEMPADVDFGTEEIEPIEEDEIDIDMEEVDEDSVNELGESYLRKVYENVASYKTRKSYVRGNSLILEGIITFTSGKKKTTGFVLEAYSANRYGKVSFRGYNSQLAKGKSSYLFEGRVRDKKLIMESLSYRYKLNEDLVRGKVKRK